MRWDGGSRAWRGAVIGGLLIAVIQIAFVFIDPTESATRMWLRIGHAMLASATVVLLVKNRHVASDRLVRICFVVACLPILVVVWMDEAERAATGAAWAPFVGPKLVAVGIALLAPGPLWLGAGLIAAFALETVVLARLHQLAGPGEIVHGEPWITLVYVTVALGLLVHRLRAQEIESAMGRARADQEVVTRLARVSLAVRDMASTPLQTLELDLALLRQTSRGATVPLDRMARSLEQLRDLRRVLAAHETTVHWQQGSESFDAIERLAPPTAAMTSATIGSGAGTNRISDWFRRLAGGMRRGHERAARRRDRAGDG